jgi:hypothetical protein
LIGLDVWMVYAVIGLAIVAYASDRWSIEFVSLGIMAALAAGFFRPADGRAGAFR